MTLPCHRSSKYTLLLNEDVLAKSTDKNKFYKIEGCNGTRQTFLGGLVRRHVHVSRMQLLTGLVAPLKNIPSYTISATMGKTVRNLYRRLKITYYLIKKLDDMYSLSC